MDYHFLSPEGQHFRCALYILLHIALYRSTPLVSTQHCSLHHSEQGLQPMFGKRPLTEGACFRCRSKFDVARHLGIQVQRRPGGSDAPDADMADADVAAVLMSMPHDNGYDHGHSPSAPRPSPGCRCDTFRMQPESGCRADLACFQAGGTLTSLVLLTDHVAWLGGLCCSPSCCRNMWVVTAGQHVCPAE